MIEPGSDAATGQRDHWESALSGNPDMFGVDPSDSAVAASSRFHEIEATSVLELGAGQGRDTFYFIRQGFKVTASDFSESGLDSIRDRAAANGAVVRCVGHDVSLPLPFYDESFDVCYSHMLFSMALRTEQLVSLMEEVRRVLRPGGLVAYTARTTGDAHYGSGVDKGDDMFEHSGFVIHYFGTELVERLTEGFEMIDRFEFNEGDLPRSLISVTMQKI